MIAKVGVIGQIQPVKLSLIYKTVLKGFNSGFWWSYYSGKNWSGILAFPGNKTNSFYCSS
jgi:hypothetical protein